MQLIDFVFGVVASLSAAVHEILLPIMKEIKNDFNSIKNDLSSLNKTVSDIKRDLSSLNDSISENVEAHDNQVTTELIKLHGIATPLVLLFQYTHVGVQEVGDVWSI